jgi:hypothetical protein
MLDTTILENNNLRYDIKDRQYALPDFKELNKNMSNQISMIKQNGYLLPSPSDVEDIEKRKNVICPIKFI